MRTLSLPPACTPTIPSVAVVQHGKRRIVQVGRDPNDGHGSTQDPWPIYCFIDLRGDIRMPTFFSPV
jgi:hypothetical protein